MAVETITAFTPQLVTAISDHVLTVSDHCLAKGLISNEVYKSVLESTNTTDSKSRNLLIAIKDTIALDNGRFEVMIGILKDVVFSTSVEISSDLDKPVLLITEMERKYQKLTKSDSDCRHKRTTSDPVVMVCESMPGPLKSSQSMSMISSNKPTAITVASKVRVIERFTPRLVSAISSSIEEISDECLARGLIRDGTYRQLIELTSISKKNRARKLLLAIKKNICSDSRCFTFFLTALMQKLPNAISESLVSEIKAESKKLTSVPAANNAAGLSDPPSEVEENLSSGFHAILDKFEKANTKLAEANYEKRMLEKKLELKKKENDELKAELRRIKAERRESENAERIKYLDEQIAQRDCEISTLKETVKEKEEEIEECRMTMKREKRVVEENKFPSAEARELEKLKEQNDKLQQQNELLIVMFNKVQRRLDNKCHDYDKLEEKKRKIECEKQKLQMEYDWISKIHAKCIQRSIHERCFCDRVGERYCPRDHHPFSPDYYRTGRDAQCIIS